MKSYIILSLAAIAFLVFAFASLTVAIALLSLETYKTLVATYDFSVENFNYLNGVWHFIRYTGAF